MPRSDFILAWVFLGLEISLACKPIHGYYSLELILMFLVPSWLGHLGAVVSLTKLRMRHLFRLWGDEVPTVDVLITCCGESLDVILDTVRAACVLDYPQEKYRVILTDDANSADLKHHVDIMKKTQPNLFYTAHNVEASMHTKAANLRHGFSFMEKLETGPSEYVAVLDVDMIPTPSLLRALLPHLLNDPSVVMATSPQLFYNIPDGDPLCQGLEILYDLYLLVQDTTDNNFCPGTGFVVLRSALEEIGGTPYDQMNEEIMTSLVLRAKGWKIAYVWEPLQWGLVPQGFAGHAKQAMRWAQGLACLLSAFWDSRLANLSIGKRLQSVVSIFGVIGSSFALTSAMFFLPAVLISGKPFIVAKTAGQLRNLVTLSALQFVVMWLNGLVAADAAGFRAPIWPPYRHPFLAPIQSFGFFSLLFPSTKSFATAGNMDVMIREREREALGSKSFIERLKLFLGDQKVWPYLFVVISMVSGVTTSVKKSLSMDVSFQHQIHHLFTSLAWPPAFVHCAMLIVYCWIPVSHAIFPRKLPDREALLNRDPDTKVAYPTDMAKDRVRTRPSQGFAIFVLAYAVFVLAYCWKADFV